MPIQQKSRLFNYRVCFVCARNDQAFWLESPLLLLKCFMALQYVAFLLRLSKCLIGDVFMTFPSMQMDNSSFHSVSQSTSNNFVRNLTCGHQRWLTECHKNQFLRCAAIAQWIHLRLPYCHPRCKSHAHNLHFNLSYICLA